MPSPLTTTRRRRVNLIFALAWEQYRPITSTDRGPAPVCCRGRGRLWSIDVREPMSEYGSMAAVAAFGRDPGRAVVS
jgi:hypothetical protein